VRHGNGLQLAGLLAGLALIFGASAAAAADGGGGAAARAGVAGAAGAPNIVLVVVDDESQGSFNRATLPNLFDRVVAPGTRFDDFALSTPLCCPFRANLLSGQYGHNNGVLDNDPGYGSLREKRNVLPAWLRAAGYRTGHFGHYLNGYKQLHSIADPAPGWGHWQATGGHVYYRYTEGTDHRAQRHLDRPRDHVTSVINRRAAAWVREETPRARPLYVQIDQLAPHLEYGQRTPGPCEDFAIPQPRDLDLVAGAPFAHDGAFNEADVSDKPSFVAGLPPLGGAAIERIEQTQRCEFAAMAGVDRGLKQLLASFRRAGELRRTAVIYTNDNGFFHGEHRLTNGKVLPYEEAVRVPLAIRLPGGPRRQGSARVGAPATAVDLAPTILDLAGARPCAPRLGCRTLDGRSLLPLLGGDGDAWGAERAIPLEYRLSGSIGASSCEYHGVRQGTSKWVEHVSVAPPGGGPCRPASEIEHYELGSDPFELRNLWPAAAGSARAAKEVRLRRLASRLSDCAGIRGRDPRPPSGHWCR